MKLLNLLAFSVSLALALAILSGAPSVVAGPTQVPQPPAPARDFGQSLVAAANSVWVLTEAVGEMTMWLGDRSTNLLGLLVLAALPLSFLGAWTLVNWIRIVNALGFRRTVGH